MTGLIFLLTFSMILMLCRWIERLEKRIKSHDKQIELLANLADLAGKNIDWERGEKPRPEGNSRA